MATDRARGRNELCRLLLLDFARRDHALPLGDLALDVGAHFRRAARSGFATELDQALPRVGIGERLAHLRVQPLEDRPGCAPGRAEADERIHFVPGNGLCDRRYVWQRLPSVAL